MDLDLSAEVLQTCNSINYLAAWDPLELPKGPWGVWP